MRITSALIEMITCLRLVVIPPSFNWNSLEQKGMIFSQGSTNWNISTTFTTKSNFFGGLISEGGHTLDFAPQPGCNRDIHEDLPLSRDPPK